MIAYDNFFGDDHNLFQLFQPQQSETELGEMGRDMIRSEDRTQWRNHHHHVVGRDATKTASIT